MWIWSRGERVAGYLICDAGQEATGPLGRVVPGNHLSATEPRRHPVMWETFRNETTSLDPLWQQMKSKRGTAGFFALFSSVRASVCPPPPISSPWCFPPASNWLRPFCCAHKLHKLAAPAPCAFGLRISVQVLTVTNPPAFLLTSFGHVTDWSGVCLAHLD